MTECEFCTLMKGKMNKVYEDSQIFVMHSMQPATFGHLLVLPKKHVMIIEQLADYEISEIFEKVNKISTAVFESLGAHGTNIILQNGVAAGQNHSHLMIHVIPRREGDGIDFTWQPKHLSEEEMSTIELKLKEAAKNIGAFEEKPAEPVEMDTKVEKIKEPEGDEENYLIKQLDRIP
ncbi:HIT family protein [Candidatus Woesearchaeota archaeon]|nr:HIT family protein [Candidatus Woesearchaeota archaeon]